MRAALVVTLSVATAGAASAQARSGVFGPINAPTAVLDCSDVGFLISLTERQTDRLVGVPFFGCVKAGLTQGWVADSRVVRPGRGDAKGGNAKVKACPTDFYIVGFSASTGEYSADTHGGAKPVPARMLADLSPVCRSRESILPPLNTSRLTGAKDNHIQQVAWDGLGGARSCNAGYAAVKISFSYEAGTDPANVFRDAALTCKRLPVLITQRPQPLQKKPTPRP